MLWTYVTSGIKGERIVRTVLKKKRIAKNKSKKFRVGKVIKRKGDKLYVKWKGYDRIALLTVGLIK